MEKGSRRGKSATFGIWISIFTYIVLSTIKLIFGFITHSESLKADGFNNLTDVFASIAVLIGMTIAKIPPDENHPYGHRRAETIASLLASFIIFSVGLNVLINAIEKIITHQYDQPNMFAAWLSLITGMIMLVVYIYNSYLAKKTDNLALKSVAKDNLSDSLVSFGVFIGVMGSQFHLYWLDPVFAIIIGLIICYTGFEIFKETSHMLSDGFDEEQLLEFNDFIQELPEVIEVADIKARKYANEVYVDLIVEVEPKLSIIEGHEITDKIEKEMKKNFGVKYTHIHLEPYQK